MYVFLKPLEVPHRGFANKKIGQKNWREQVNSEILCKRDIIDALKNDSSNKKAKK